MVPKTSVRAATTSSGRLAYYFLPEFSFPRNKFVALFFSLVLFDVYMCLCVCLVFVFKRMGGTTDQIMFPVRRREPGAVTPPENPSK